MGRGSVLPRLPEFLDAQDPSCPLLGMRDIDASLFALLFPKEEGTPSCVTKFALKLSRPIEFKRIRNGEKVIVQTGPTEYDVEVSGEPEFISRGSQTARAKNHRCPRPDANGSGTAVGELRLNWRGRREQKTTALNEPPVPSPAKTHYIAPFELSWAIKKAVVANGEIVFDEVVAPAAAAPPGGADGPEGPNFQSRRSLRRREQKTTEGDPEGEEALEVTVGERYLTPSGVPIQVLSVAGDQLLVQSLASENRFPLPAGYPLRRWGSDEPAFPVKETPNRPIDQAQPTRPPEKRPIAPLIDAMLLAGDMTMKGILRELRRKASAACQGKNLRANVRARISHLRRKGLNPRLASGS